jgi:hypothetical protein
MVVIVMVMMMVKVMMMVMMMIMMMMVVMVYGVLRPAPTPAAERVAMLLHATICSFMRARVTFLSTHVRMHVRV